MKSLNYEIAKAQGYNPILKDGKYFTEFHGTSLPDYENDWNVLMSAVTLYDIFIKQVLSGYKAVAVVEDIDSYVSIEVTDPDYRTALLKCLIKVLKCTG